MVIRNVRDIMYTLLSLSNDNMWQNWLRYNPLIYSNFLSSTCIRVYVLCVNLHMRFMYYVPSQSTYWTVLQYHKDPSHCLFIAVAFSIFPTPVPNFWKLLKFCIYILDNSGYSFFFSYIFCKYYLSETCLSIFRIMSFWVKNITLVSLGKNWERTES